MPTVSESGSGRGRRIAAISLGVAVSAGLLWFATRGLRLSDVLVHIREVAPGPLLLSVALATVTFPLRALRWRLLLRLHDGSPLPLSPAWHGITIGYMANNLLPLRAGEVFRAYAASRLAPVRLGSALASVAVERVFDALTVVAMLVAALLTANLPAEVRIGDLSVPDLARRIGIIAGIALVGAGVLLSRAETAARLIEKLVPWPTASGKLISLFLGIRDGLVALRSPVRLFWVALWSLVIWSVNALSFQVLFPAFGIEAGFGAAVLVQSMIVFFIAAPSTPGYAGVFETAIIAALALYGIERDRALAFALTYHAATFFPITLMGLWSVTHTIGWRTLRRARSQPDLEDQPA